MKRVLLFTAVLGLGVLLWLRPAAACENVRDARLNDSPARDCAAPVVLFLGGVTPNGVRYLDIYGVGGGRVDLVLSLPSITWELAPPARDRTLIDTAVIPGTGQQVRVYLLLGGEVLVESNYEDGKPYTIVYDPDGAQAIIPVQW